MKYLLLIILLGSCASTHVTKPTTSKFAPKNYQAKGMVKYLNQGADFIIKRRRESAFKTMYMACNGRYEITHETDKNTNVSSQWGWGYGYWYISYKCI